MTSDYHGVEHNTLCLRQGGSETDVGASTTGRVNTLAAEVLDTTTYAARTELASYRNEKGCLVDYLPQLCDVRVSLNINAPLVLSSGQTVLVATFDPERSSKAVLSIASGCSRRSDPSTVRNGRRRSDEHRHHKSAAVVCNLSSLTCLSLEPAWYYPKEMRVLPRLKLRRAGLDFNALMAAMRSSTATTSATPVASPKRRSEEPGGAALHPVSSTHGGSDFVNATSSLQMSAARYNQIVGRGPSSSPVRQAPSMPPRTSGSTTDLVESLTGRVSASGQHEEGIGQSFLEACFSAPTPHVLHICRVQRALPKGKVRRELLLLGPEWVYLYDCGGGELSRAFPVATIRAVMTNCVCRCDAAGVGCTCCWYRQRTSGIAPQDVVQYQASTGTIPFTVIDAHGAACGTAQSYCTLRFTCDAPQSEEEEEAPPANNLSDTLQQIRADEATLGDVCISAPSISAFVAKLLLVEPSLSQRVRFNQTVCGFSTEAEVGKSWELTKRGHDSVSGQLSIHSQVGAGSPRVPPAPERRKAAKALVGQRYVQEVDNAAPAGVLQREALFTVCCGTSSVSAGFNTSTPGSWTLSPASSTLTGTPRSPRTPLIGEFSGSDHQIALHSTMSSVFSGAPSPSNRLPSRTPLQPPLVLEHRMKWRYPITATCDVSTVPPTTSTVSSKDAAGNVEHLIASQHSVSLSTHHMVSQTLAVVTPKCDRQTVNAVVGVVVDVLAFLEVYQIDVVVLSSPSSSVASEVESHASFHATVSGRVEARTTASRVSCGCFGGTTDIVTIRIKSEQSCGTASAPQLGRAHAMHSGLGIHFLDVRTSPAHPSAGLFSGASDPQSVRVKRIHKIQRELFHYFTTEHSITELLTEAEKTTVAA